MGYQAIFKRYESKYILTAEQKEKILFDIEPFMALDKYGRTSIRNVYFDTPSFRLIRRSIEKPEYKEKLRLRSYGIASDGVSIFVELKKKYKRVVYKRRIAMPEADAMAWFCDGGEAPSVGQIAEEIDYFKKLYSPLMPKAFLSYEREAYYLLSGGELRVTFDDNIMSRTDGLSLSEDVGGERILDDGLVLMEIKSAGGIPVWLTNALSREQIYKTSFSKYGTAYQNIILPKIKETKKYGITV